MPASSGSITTQTANATHGLVGKFLAIRLPIKLLAIIGTCCFSANASDAIVLISETNSTRAIAVESSTFLKEPFSVRAPLAPDGRLRVMIFALNVALEPREDISAITADAETADHQHYPLQVEYVGPTRNLPTVSSVILRLNDDLVDAGDVLVSLTLHGRRSNRVRIGIGTVGGGPPDDPGAVPTPFPLTVGSTPVLQFDGQPKTVDYSNFWPPYTNLGHFFWEFWAMPGASDTPMYMLSDGYGGLHALLFGFGAFGLSEPNRYELIGNMNDGISGGDHIFYFGGDHGPALGEWGHFAVGWDGQNVITYFNGVPVGKTPYSRPRQSAGPDNGSGRLFIGGSDHLNFNGRMAEVRGYEGNNPRESTSVESAFAPETVFSSDGNLLSNFFTPATVVDDLSRGYQDRLHPGTVRGTAAGALTDCGSCPPPQFVIDPTAPNFVQNIPSQPVAVPIPVPVPSAALVFDSFSRPNSTYTFRGRGGLGYTEGGLAGPQTWQMLDSATQLKPFGLLNGRAVPLADDTAVCWVATGAAMGNLDIQVDRRPGRWGSGTNTGLSFRVFDQSNYFFAYTSDSTSSSGQILTVGSVVNGSRNTLATATVPANWSTLRVVTRISGGIQVYIDSSLMFSTSNTSLATATKAGLYNNSRGLGLVNRWDDFRVFEAVP
jgi:Concanavalin A-like lectin/glucanases superfamily